MGIITSANVATAIVKLVAADALPALMGNLVMGNLVNRDYEPTLARGFPVGRRIGTARPQPIARQVVERRPRPAERFDHVELVGPSAIVELLVFLFEIVSELDRQEELDADAGVAEELVVQERPDERSHLTGITLDLLGLVHTIDQDDDASETQRVENSLKLAQ